MLTIHEARKPRAKKDTKIGLAIAGGGPVGAIYELGALRALDEAINGLKLHDLDVYVGVSSGGFIAASLANRISTSEMCRIFTGHDHAEYRFEPSRLLKPAYREYLQRASSIPRVLARSIARNLKDPFNASLASLFGEFGEVIPSGVFDNEAINQFLLEVFENGGYSNDFRELNKKLYIVAVDLDSGAAVRFGSPELNDIPISRAVQASAALPGMYPPVQIGDRYYVDGALRRTMHASVALHEGIDLLIGVNPLVPFDSGGDDQRPHVPVKQLIQGGLPLILSQAFRALIQSRMNVAFKKYRETHPAADLLVIEPDRGDTDLFFTNVFSFASRNALCEHAYRRTREDLRRNAPLLDHALQRHGLSLNLPILEQHDRTLADSLSERWYGHTDVGRTLSRALEDLEFAINHP